MLITAEGIVLKQRKIAGNRRMIVIFSKQYGKISAGTSINEKSRNRAALALRPFTLAEYDIFKGRESYSINAASTKRSYYSIGEDLDRFMAASAMINYLDKVLLEGEPMPGLFELALEFLESVSQTKHSADTLLYAFIVKSFRILGVSPELKCCVNCGKPLENFGIENGGKIFRQFSVTSGGIICEECSKIEKTSGDALIYKPSFDIIDVFDFFISRHLKTFEKVSLKKDVSGTIRNLLSEYSSRYLGIDVLSEYAGIEN